MSKTEIIAYHGWGFDHRCWQPLYSQLPEEIMWLNFDRGYFGKPHYTEFSEASSQKIVVTHSFGLHLCADKVLKRADVVIIISGFLSFHPEHEPYKTRSRRILKKMFDQFDQDPRKVLHQFYKKVFHPQKVTQTVPENINHSLILEDLQRLNSSKRSLSPLKKTEKICILNGTKDVIVSVEKSQSLKEKLENNACLFDLESAGHALPMTHSTWCADVMNEFLTA